MSISSGPKIIKDSLLIDLDAANYKQTESTTIINLINPFTTSYSPYNNPGFTTTTTRTNEIFKGAPVYKITFSPQNASMISRLGSTEGFGFVHGNPTFLPNTPYMASVYFRTNYPVNTSTFSNTYSNISGWGNSSTGATRYTEGNWTRFYTRFLNNTVVNGVSYVSTTVYDTFQAIFNTTATTDVLVTLTIAANGAYTTVTNYGTLTSGTLNALSSRKVFIGANPYVSNAGSISGLAIGTGAILNHGLDTTNWAKFSTSNPRFVDSDLPLTYYINIRVPSTGGVNRTVTFYPIFTMGATATTDGKYWKITFNTSRLAVGDVIETYWAAPMVEQTSRLYPSTFTLSSTTSNFFTSTTWPDLSGNSNNGTLSNGPLYNSSGSSGHFFFDGTDDYLTTPALFTASNYWTTSFWIYPSTGGWLISPYSGGFDHYVSYDSGNKRVGVSLIPSADTTTYSLNSTVNSVPLNTWTNVVISVNDLDVKIYINGVLNASGTATAGHNLVWSGTWRWCQRSTGQFSMQARLGNIKIYNTILTANQIKQNFEGFRKRYNI